MGEQDDAIKRLIVSNQADVTRLLLLPDELKVFNFCRDMGGAMSSRAALALGISTEIAGITLRKLHALGYLTRTEIRYVAAAGEVDYVYYAWV